MMFRSKRVWALLSLVTIVALLVTSCAPAATPAPTPTPLPPPTPVPAPKEEVKAAFVYVAPIGDLGWTWAHEQGRLMVENELGIETAFIENVPEGPDAERVIRDFATKGYDVIFATSFGFMDHMLTVAQEFPDKYFEHCSGYKTADNVATYFGRMYQPRFLSGLVAGKATKANKIGYVAAFPIPEVVRGINAFTLGVRAANPAATVHVVWTSTRSRRKKQPWPCWTRAATSSPSTRIPPSPKKQPRSEARSVSATTLTCDSSWAIPS